ncbi:DNA-binding transcriptional regulator, AcrR family [Thermomonospora echinospora]|uniref:DNA-binding transcriptional regulator, AcrR family n=1 Tax=Thermomonospora echinospora TaxID=1992 RepID=A0A1H5V1T6_9ACTN|nr:TetR family transcriptional regulator [Thermomonospora echinospora]SEF81243.1 DNA-binding transcriptional regulator, AcrR family [Thermomonospora echinospora]
MTDGRRQPARSRSQQERRKKIIKSAAALASRGGVEAMQMRTVAERAGVALGTLYRYFPSKMDLVVAVVDEELDLLEGSIAKRPPRSSTPAERALDVLTRATRGLIREPELTEALIRALMLTDLPVAFGDRMTTLLLHAATGQDEPIAVDDPRWAKARALSSAWIMEMIELLRGRSEVDQIHARLEIAAHRLIDF